VSDAAPDDPDESWVIAALRDCGPPSAEIVVDIGDDAAVWADGRVVTTDTMVEGTHWDARLSAEDVGWKLVAVNVSDVGAMGGRPEWAVLALTLPAPLERAWVAAFARGVRAACARWGVRLVGGDTTRGPTRVASLTVGGRAARPVLRSGGQPGDTLWIAGELGLAAEAFLAEAPSAAALRHFRRPEPPVAFGAALGEAGLATAMMDLSDGLRPDLARLCAASGCGARVDAAQLPGKGPLAWRVAFGEDYALCFAARAIDADAIVSLSTMYDVPVRPIGALTSTPSVTLVGNPGAADASGWPAPLFAHFARPPSPGAA
jgi:thiamine-monophosphate kinase